MPEAHSPSQQVEVVPVTDPLQAMRGPALRNYVAGSELLGCIQHRTKQGRFYYVSPPRPGEFAPNEEIPKNVLEGELEERRDRLNEAPYLGHVEEGGLTPEDAALDPFGHFCFLDDDNFAAILGVSNGWGCLTCFQLWLC